MKSRLKYILTAKCTVRHLVVAEHPSLQHLILSSLLDSLGDCIYVLTPNTRCALMAPMAVYQSLPTKRSASSASFEPFGLPPHKKQNRGQIHHHQPNWNFQREQIKEPWQDEEAVRSMLTRSISLALEAVGFEAAAPDAMEAFRVDVEECMKSDGNC